MKKKNTEIKNLRTKKYQTLRPISSGLEGILYSPLKALDKGFIRVVDYMGNRCICSSSCKSFLWQGVQKKSEDRGLIRYLLRHRHTTPFEMCEIKLHKAAYIHS